MEIVEYEYIKPCPHCGGTACLHGNYSRKIKSYFVFAKCDICGAQAKVYKSPENPEDVDWDNQACIDAVAAWNLRVNEKEA